MATWSRGHCDVSHLVRYPRQFLKTAKFLLMGVVLLMGLLVHFLHKCDEVVAKVNEFILQGYKVNIRCLGLSRGGMAVLMLIQRLAAYPKLNVTMDCLLFDPVPGNLITSASWDYLGSTLAGQCLDVSASKNLESVLAIYPYRPLPDLAFHAPILSKYPETTKVREIVTLGCHQGALYDPNTDYACYSSFAMIKDFLTEHGVPFQLSPYYDHDSPDKYLLTGLDRELARDSVSIRYTHSYVYTTIERLSPSEQTRYLNYLHYLLLVRCGNIDPENEEFDESRCLLQIKRQICS